MTEEERRKKFAEVVNQNRTSTQPITRQQYVDYMDETGSTQIKPTAPQTLTQGAFNNRYGHVINSYNSVNRTDIQKADDRLYSQWQAYQKAIDARKNAKLFSRDEYKASELAKSLKQELKKAYTERYGSDAGFGKWLASGTMTGLMGFANGVYQTAGMVEDTLTNTANKVYSFLQNGTNPTRQYERELKQAEKGKAAAENQRQILAQRWNALANGNVDYAKRPYLSPEVMKSKGWDIGDNDIATTLTSSYSIGDGGHKYTVLVTPIMDDGTVLTPKQLDDYVSTLLIDEGTRGVLADDKSKKGIIIGVVNGWDDHAFDEYEEQAGLIKQADWQLKQHSDNAQVDEALERVYTAYKNAQAARKGAGAFSGVSGETWASLEEQLREQFERIYNEQHPATLFDPEGGLFHQAAERSNELYNWQQERNQIQTEFQKTRSGNDKAWDIANQLVIGTAQAVPYAAFGMAGMGAAGGEIGAQLAPQTTSILEKVASTIQGYVKDPNYWLAFSQETGNTYREALDAGANQDTAALTATLVGLINGAVELGLGGDNAGIQDLPERLMKAGKGTRKAVQEWIESAVSEGKEEVIQGVISNLAEKIGYNRSKAWIGEGGVIDPKTLAQEGFMGMAVGGILGGGQSLGVNAYNRSVQNRIAEQYKQTGARFRGKVDTIIENALALPETTEAYKQAQELKSRQSEDLTEEQKKSLYSDEEIGRLYSQTLRDTGVDYNARADALSAIEQRLQKLGETSNTRETAELVLEAAENGALSTTAKATALKNSKYGQRVLNEYRDALSGEIVPQYDSEWADKLQLREMQKKVPPELTQEERTARTEWAEQVINNNENPAEEADINKLAQKYGEQANVFKEAAKSVEGTDLYYFDDAYHLVYQEAKAGLSEDTIRRDVKASLLSPAAFKLAYNAGQSDIKMPKGSRFTGSAGVRLNGIDYKSLNNKQRASVRALQTIAQITGIRIELFDSTQADGTLGEKQGWYSKGAIGIDINAGMLDKGDILNVAMLRTTSHELTHFIQDNNDTAYKELKDFVFSALQTYQFSDGKYRDADTWIRSKMSQNKWEYEEGTAEFNKYYQQASDECVADACEMMLRDSTAFETLAKENQSLAQRMLGWLKQLIADIKKAFSGVVETSLEARAMLDSLDELQKKWDAALVGAVQNTKLTAEETAQLNEAGVEVSEEYATVNSVRYLLAADKKTQLAKLLAKQYGVTEQEAKAWMNAETSLASMILNPKYSAYLDYEADTDEQAIKSNSDYPQGTVDFSNICAKRREFTMIVNRILRMFPNHVFAATDLAKMRTIMEEEGMTVPCAICYVEDRRQHDTLVAQSFIDNLQRYRDGETTDINGKKFGRGQIKAFDMVKGDEYTPTIYELASLEGLNQLKAKDDTMKKAWETYNNARGMASIRLPLNDAEYDRQILKYSPNTVKRKNDHGGLRIYSFSDLEMFHLIDIIQVITDSSVVGLKIQGYTKVNEYAKAVRNTGEKLNRSLIPAGDLGYHIENGKVILDYDTKEGIDINHPDFFDSKDNANVGNIVIGINPTQIRVAMVSDFVDMIIPFHTGQSSAVLQEKGLAAWQNYKDSQTEKDLDTGRTSDHQINIYTEVLQVLENEGAEINKRSFVEKFLEVCKENNLRPRFAEFLNVDENGDYVYTEGYHKFLVDFKTFAQTEVGEYLPQLAVKPDFDNEYISTMLEQYVKDQKVKDAEIAEKAPRVLERIRDEIVNDDVQNSLRVTPEQDKRYMELAKDPQKNEAELREMVKRAAAAANYDTPLLFHGTRWFGWTIYKDSEHDTPFIYTSTNPTVSSHYAGDQHYAGRRPIGRKYRTGNSIEDIIQNAETVYGAKYHVMSDDERQTVYNEETSKAVKIADEIDAAYVPFDNIPDEVGNAMSWVVDPFFVVRDNESFHSFPDHKLTPLTENIEDKRQELNESLHHFEESARVLKEWYGEHRAELSAEQKKYISYLLGYDVGDAAIYLQYRLARVLEDDVIVNENGGINKPAEMKEAMDEYHNIGAYELYGNLGVKPYIIDCKGAQFWAIKNPDMGDGYYGTVAIAKWALEHGYTSVIMKNIYDYGDKADNYVFFSSNQIKSADPVTYDDDGNVIPLSERFNEENEDIRYQIRETGLSARELLSTALVDVAQTDAERDRLKSYQRAVKTLDETQAQLDDVRSQIHDIMFTKGSDRSKLKALNAQKAQLEKKLDWWDKRLMSLQNTAPLKAVLDRERARVRKQTRTEVMENVREKRETSAVRKSIKSMMEKWNSKLQANDPNKNIPAPFARTITELSDALDLTSGRPLSEKAVDKLNKLKSVYDIIMNDEDYKTLQDPITKMYLDNAIDAINNTPLRQMGREQLEALYDAMKCINNAMFEANKLRDKAYRRDTAETGKAMIGDTDEAIAPKWKFWRDYETWQLTPERFFAMLGGWKKGSAWEQVAASFKEGTRRSIRYERDFYNTFRAFTEAPEIDRLTNPNKLIDIGLMDRNGKPVKITRGMMLSIYMHLLAEDNRRAILYGGLNIPVLKEYYGQKIASSYTTGHENVVGILEDMTKLSEQIYRISTDKSLSEEEKQKKIEEIGEQQDKLEAEGYDRLDALKNRIYNEMTDFEKKLTETATYWNDVKSAGYINEVTMEMYQIKRARVKNYWAIHRDTSFVKTDFESIAKNMNLSNVGWLKDRVKSAAPVLLTDFVYELDNSCKRVATFYGYSIAQADFNKLYNYKLPGVNKSVKNAVMSKFGGGSKSFGVTADQYVENFIGDVVGSRVKPDTTVWAAIRRNLPRASLTLNPRVAVSQIASVPTAAAEVGWGAMAKGFFKGLPRVFNKEAKAWLDEHDEYFWQRHRGDGGMREFADMKSGNNVIDKLFTKADKLTKHVLFNWCQNFDIFATATMWSMAEEWVKANTNLTGEEFDAAVKEKYDAIITKTQPNYTTTERSDLLRDTREGYKFLTMYKTQSNQNFNILKEANARLRKTASDFKNKKNGVTQQDLNEARKQFANAYSAVFLGGTLAFVLLRALANALLGHMNDYRDDDDEITKASVLNGITVACMQSLSGMFALGSEFEALVEKTITGKKYYGLEDTALASVNNVVTQLQALAVAYAQGETDGVGKKWAKLMQNGAQIVGIPYSPGKTWYEAVRTWAKDIDNGSFGSFEGGVTRTNTTNYNRLYKALENGDIAKADRIREEIRRNTPDIEDKTIESGLRGVIKGMWADGLLTESEAVDKLVDYTGKDKDTAYWDVQKWSNKANAEDDEKYTDSNYYRLWQVIDNDGDAEAAMSELLEHGKDADQIAQDVRKHIKDAYTNGEITDTQARERMLKYGQHKENKQIVPYTKAEVDKLVNGWVTSNTLGWDYDDKETLYAKGEISKSELKTALVDIGGMTSEKADQRIEIMDWNKEGYAVENDKYDSIIGEYNKKLKSHGISKSIWYNYYVFESKTSGEVDANGKSIPYSKMRKLFEYIGNLNITSEQKMALARTYTDSESSIAKYKTW